MVGQKYNLISLNHFTSILFYYISILIIFNFTSYCCIEAAFEVKSAGFYDKINLVISLWKYVPILFGNKHRIKLRTQTYIEYSTITHLKSCSNLCCVSYVCVPVRLCVCRWVHLSDKGERETNKKRERENLRGSSLKYIYHRYNKWFRVVFV